MRIWGDEAVVYDTASGDTHYLRPLTLALYQACRSHPGRSAEALAAALASREAATPPGELFELVQDGLSSLQRIGLLHKS